MRTPYGAWRASYTPGRWVVLSGPTSMIVLEPAPASASDLLNAVWDKLLASASVAEITAALAGFGLDAMPNLAVLFWDGDSLFCLLRGQARITDAETGEELASGAGAHTWYEADLSTPRVQLVLDDAPTGELLRLPLVVGAAEASTVFIDTEQVTVGAGEAEPIAAVTADEPAPADADEQADDEPIEEPAADVDAEVVAAVPAEAELIEPESEPAAEPEPEPEVVEAEVVEPDPEPDSEMAGPEDAEFDPESEPTQPDIPVIEAELLQPESEPEPEPAEPEPAQVDESALEVDQPAAEPSPAEPEPPIVVPPAASPHPLIAAAAAPLIGAAAAPLVASGQPEEDRSPEAEQPPVDQALEPEDEAPEPDQAPEAAPAEMIEVPKFDNGPEFTSAEPEPEPAIAEPEPAPAEPEPAPEPGPAEPAPEPALAEPVPAAASEPQPAQPQFGGAPPPPFGMASPTPVPELAVSPPRGGFSMAPAAAPVGQPVGMEPTEVLGQRPDYAPGQEPGAAGLAAQTFGQGESGNAGPWGAEGFVAAADLPGAGAPPEVAPQPMVSPQAPIVAPVRHAPSTSDNDGETVFTTGIAATHKPSAGRNTDENLVLAAICALGHANQPGAMSCRICGGHVDSHNPQLVNRPLLAIVATSAGEQLPLTGPILIGRAPSNTGNDLDAELMRVPSPNHDISRTHVRVAPHEWSIEVSDLYSTNGTIVVPPGGQQIRLEPGQSVELGIGGQIDLGDGQVIELLSPQ